jgi:hypothetical protein
MPLCRVNSVQGDLKASLQAKVKQYKLDLGVCKETIDGLTRKVLTNSSFAFFIARTGPRHLCSWLPAEACAHFDEKHANFEPTKQHKAVSERADLLNGGSHSVGFQGELR